MKRTQLSVFFTLLFFYALCAFLTYAFFSEQIASSVGVPLPELGVSNPVVGLANAGIVLVLYSLLGMAGFGLARKLRLPGIFSPDGNWHRWVVIPAALGAGCGSLLILGDLIFAPFNDFGRFPHPPFPVSILASLSAGIGEEILFRGFVFGLWGVLLSWLLGRFNRHTVALWMANILAALAFGAGHLGSALFLTGATTPAELHPVLTIEILLLNGIVGIVAGVRYLKDGLVAAVGVHFWTDIVWHVFWGLFS